MNHLAALSPGALATRLPSLVLAVAAALLAGWWLTHLMAPRPTARLAAPSAPQAPVRVEDALKVFGLGAQPAESPDGIGLTGIYAPSHGRGFATFRTARGAKFVFADEEVAPGVRLQQVAADHVVLLAGGVERRLELRRKAADAPPKNPEPNP